MLPTPAVCTSQFNSQNSKHMQTALQSAPRPTIRNSECDFKREDLAAAQKSLGSFCKVQARMMRHKKLNLNSNTVLYSHIPNITSCNAAYLHFLFCSCPHCPLKEINDVRCKDDARIKSLWLLAAHCTQCEVTAYITKHPPGDEFVKIIFVMLNAY